MSSNEGNMDMEIIQEKASTDHSIGNSKRENESFGDIISSELMGAVNKTESASISTSSHTKLDVANMITPDKSSILYHENYVYQSSSCRFSHNRAPHPMILPSIACFEGIPIYVRYERYTV